MERTENKRVLYFKLMIDFFGGKTQKRKKEGRNIQNVGNDPLSCARGDSH